MGKVLVLFSAGGIRDGLSVADAFGENMANVIKRLDAKHWAMIVGAFVALGCLGCFGIAAQNSASNADADILMTDNFPAPTDISAEVAPASSDVAPAN